MTNPGPSICPKCGATMMTSTGGGMTYTVCPACKDMFWGIETATGEPKPWNGEPLPPAVDEPHADMPPVDGALLCCILDDAMSPSTLAGTLVWVYNLRGYSKDAVASMNHYRERGVRMLLSNLWEDVYGQ